MQDDLEEDKDEDVAVPEYRKLIAIHAKKKKPGLNLQAFLNDTESVSRLSLSEQALEKATKDYGRDIIRYNYCTFSFSQHLVE